MQTIHFSLTTQNNFNLITVFIVKGMQVLKIKNWLLTVFKAITDSKLWAYILIWYIIADILLIFCCISEVSAEFSSLFRTFYIMLIQNGIGNKSTKS